MLAKELKQRTPGADLSSAILQRGKCCGVSIRGAKSILEVNVILSLTLH